MNLKYKGIKQQDSSDCGPACLVAVLGYWGYNITLSKIRLLTGTNSSGTSLYALQQVALKLGFNTRGVQCIKEILHTLPVPCIVHMDLNNCQHYWLVYRCSNNKLKYMDPIDGKLHHIGLQEFKASWTGKLLWFEKPENVNQVPAISNIKRLLQLIVPQKWILMALFLTGALATIAGLAVSLFLQKLLDEVLPSGNKGLLFQTSVILLVIFVFHVLLQLFRSVLTIRMGKVIDNTLIKYYYEKILQLPLLGFNSFQTGELMSRMHDAGKIRSFIQEFSLHVIVNVMVLVFSMAVMFAASFKLALFLTASIPIFAVLIVIINKLHQKWSLQLMQQAAQVESAVTEQFQHFFAIKYLALEQRAYRVIAAVLDPFLEKTTRIGSLQVGLNAITELITKLITILLLWLGANLVLTNQLTAGELIFFFAVSGYFIGALLFFITLPARYQEAMVAVDRLFDVTSLENSVQQQDVSIMGENADQQPELFDVSESFSQQQELNVKGASSRQVLQLTNVHFAYNWGYPILENLNLLLPAGTLSAIMGNNGSGKSTLLHLIAGLYKPQHGTVFLGIHDVHSISNSSLRKAIGLVPKEVTVFKGTVIENIVLEDVNPKQEKLECIIRLFQLTEKLAHLPDGLLHSLAGNRNQLSGGQSQLIALARAFYSEPAILLLDEPTAHVDAATTQVILSAMQWYRSRGNSIIIVTHDSRIREIADNCYHLRNGRIELISI